MVFGLALVLWPHAVNTILVKVLGCVLIASALITVIQGLSDKTFTHLQGTSVLSLAGAALFLIFGLLLLLKTGFFIGFLNFLFGAILLVYGIVQIVNVVNYKKAVGCSAKAFVLPVLVAVMGILFLFNLLGADTVLTMTFGICVIALGFSDLLVLSKMKKLNK